MENTNEIILFETEDKAVTLSVPVEQETVWLNRNQMAEPLNMEQLKEKRRRI